MNSKTIWIINQYAYTPHDSASTRHFTYAQALRARGHVVQIISSTYYHKGRRQRYYDPKQQFQHNQIDGVPFTWIRVLPYQSNIKRLVNMGEFAVKLLNSNWQKDLPHPDVIMATSPSPLAAYSAMHLARKLNARFVLEVVDIWPQTLVEVSGVSPKNPIVALLGAIEKRLMLGADAILTHLSGAHEHFISRGAPPEKCNFIQSPAVLLSDSINLDEGPAPDTPFHFLHAGSLSDSYAPQQLLDAVSILRKKIPNLASKLRVSFVGEGPLLKTMKDHVTNSHIEDIVSFYPPVPKSEILEILLSANGLLLLAGDLPLHRFGISFNKIFDYMIAARPVVGACLDKNTPVSKAGSGIIVDPEKPKALADAMLKIMEMPLVQRQEMARKGHEYVKTHHTLKLWGAAAESVLLSMK